MLRHESIDGNAEALRTVQSKRHELDVLLGTNTPVLAESGNGN